MKKILVTGSKGQLGNELQVAAKAFSQFELVFTDVDELDICNLTAIEQFVKNAGFDAIVNCAAYTAVDKAETDDDLCYKINRDAVQNLAQIAQCNGLKLIHVSTDYVFDGTQHTPYVETDTVCPVSVYGKSKLAGEELALKNCDQVAVIRTSWLYSAFGNNFVKTMMRIGQERESLNVIFDQVGTPTYAADLANAILQMLNAEVFVSGVYHFSNEGVCSWYDFAKKIHQLAGVTCKVSPIETKDYPTAAVRPHYSVLNKSKIKSTYHIEIPHWEESLIKCVDILQK